MKKLIFLLCFASLPRLSIGALTSVGLDKSLYTTDFMIGSVAVGVVFPESNGGLDPNTESWDDERKSQVLSQISAALNWWTEQNPKSPLRFTLVSETIPTRYEPITRPYYDEALWIPDVMSQLGYTGNRFVASRAYANALRNTHQTDWAFVIYVIDSLVDSNGKLADGFFAYAYLGGPYMVMTYDNNGYGISNMNVVCAHEIGHIFHALDEYAGASSPTEYSIGYLPTINGNHAYSTIANDPTSIMRGGIRWGLDDWAKQMIGWRDNNSNNVDDIFDQPATHQITQTIQSNSGATNITGEASLNVLPRQGNAQGYGFTVDTISQIDYQLLSSDWNSTSASDGNFDSAFEAFSLSIPASQVGLQAVQQSDVNVRVVTSYALAAINGGGGALATDLSNAHAFPNPFKPNSNLGHTTVTFTNLTAGSKVLILSVAGEPLYDEELTGSNSTLLWQGIDRDGNKLASGVYYYLITNPSGHKKEGKIAILR